MAGSGGHRPRPSTERTGAFRCRRRFFPTAGRATSGAREQGRRSTPTCRHWKRTPEHHALGRALLELRARRGLSQEQLGFDAGRHRNYVGALERGEINPTFRVLLKLAAGLRIPLSELIAVYERHRSEASTHAPS